ncbi:hypothetical protein FB389_0840 [Rarobacter incanus]|uniref:Uncharacterized protein n=1 Tax=Rarobacter incanus TaxID=153494 RepID=A0A542SNH6_9MICO|nr:hypothetical protein FB389_0840 [Rarobacter incanus]
MISIKQFATGRSAAFRGACGGAAPAFAAVRPRPSRGCDVGATIG